MIDFDHLHRELERAHCSSNSLLFDLKSFSSPRPFRPRSAGCLRGPAPQSGSQPWARSQWRRSAIRSMATSSATATEERAVRSGARGVSRRMTSAGLRCWSHAALLCDRTGRSMLCRVRTTRPSSPSEADDPPPVREFVHQHHASSRLGVRWRAQQGGKGAGIRVAEFDAHAGVLYRHRERGRRAFAHVSDDVGDQFAHTDLSRCGDSGSPRTPSACEALAVDRPPPSAPPRRELPRAFAACSRDGRCVMTLTFRRQLLYAQLRCV